MPNGKWFIIMVIIFILFAIILVKLAGAEELTASWYSVESCLREGTSGIMANGRRLNDEDFTCAIWDYPFGSLLKVTNLVNKRYIVVLVTDRGPAKRLVKKGRVIDLSKKAFAVLAPLSQGVIPVKIEVIKLTKH